MCAQINERAGKMDEMSKSNDIALLKAHEVAGQLGISLAMVYRIMQEGELPSVKIGNAIRIRPCDLEAYINRHWSGWKTIQ